MEVVKFDRTAPLPIIAARIYGPRRSHKVKLIFDTGAEHSIIDTCLIEEVGYSVRDAKRPAEVFGAAGEAQGGYMVEIKGLRFFNKKAEDILVGAFDFEHFAHFGAQGLLGFDVIKELHLELDGPEGILKLF